MKTLSLKEIALRTMSDFHEYSLAQAFIVAFWQKNQELDIYSGIFWRKYYKTLPYLDKNERYVCFLIRQNLFQTETLSRIERDGNKCWSH